MGSRLAAWAVPECSGHRDPIAPGKPWNVQRRGRSDFPARPWWQYRPATEPATQPGAQRRGRRTRRSRCRARLALMHAGRTPPPQRPACRAGQVRAGGCLLRPPGLLAADVRHLHFLRAAGRTGAQLGVTVGAHCPDGCDLLAQRLFLGCFGLGRWAADKAGKGRSGLGGQAGVPAGAGRGDPGRGVAPAGHREPARPRRRDRDRGDLESGHRPGSAPSALAAARSS
jgi:hypothetical protein